MMTTFVRYGCYACAAFIAVIPIRTSAAQGGVIESKPVTMTATIEAIDKANRAVTLKGPKGNSIEVKADEQMEGFNRLKVGDQVSATYFEAVVVELRKPGTPPSSGKPVTTVMRKDRKPGGEARREQTFTVTIQAIDTSASSVTAKGPQGRVLNLQVSDPKQLQAVKVGDTMDLTYVESLLVNVAPPPKKN
jgi:hypothetical protein